MPAFNSERRKSMAERRPSVSYTPPVIPHLAGLEKPQEHSLKLDHVDIVILGTGLVESIVAAALSWQGVEVLHIDNKNYYGDSTSTLTIDQLKKWCVEVNQGRLKHFSDAQIYIPNNTSFKSKDYGIDLCPKIMFTKSDLLALLIKSRVYKYLEFQPLSNFHVFENDSFNKKVSNTTKEDIFTDQSLSLITKRNLMKFLKFVISDNSDPAKKKVLLDNAKTPIGEFLKSHFHLDPPQINELIYSIGLVNNAAATTPEAIARIKRFLVSFDVYGNFPVMMSKFGGPGEISQGFCRSAAVAGTTYKLDTTLVDYDPQLKVAKFNDGSHIKINEKIIVSPTQIPKFLQANYNEVTENLPLYKVTRLVTVVKKDCKEWMSESESSAIVVFPPGSLPSNNQLSVQVVIENGHTGICPEGQAVWYSQTSEQDAGQAKLDLESAYEKMESAILRESSRDIDDVLSEQDFKLNAAGTPVVVNSFKLGESLQNFVPKEKLEIVMKIGYVQTSYVNPDLSNVIGATDANNIVHKVNSDTEDIIFSNMPSAEISYDGIILEAKHLFLRITGSDEDFFDVDFEDDDDDYSSNVHDNAAESAIADSDDDLEDHHEPFGAAEMEL